MMSEEHHAMIPAYYYLYSHLGQYLCKNGLGWPYGLSYPSEGQCETFLKRRVERKKSFLIDDILASDKDDDKEDDDRIDREELTDNFSWLQCTRYKPPKIPRSPKKEGGGKKRKLGRNPRVPFTQHQVSTLEQKFRRTHYLSSLDVAELSAGLNLTETRVKIWFQNRRARERREREHIRPSINQGSSSPPNSAGDDTWLSVDEQDSVGKFSPDPKADFYANRGPTTTTTTASLSSALMVADLSAQWIPASQQHATDLHVRVQS